MYLLCPRAGSSCSSTRLTSLLSEAESSEIVGPDVSHGWISTVLHARTEGWAVALQLARLWLERGHRTPESLRDSLRADAEMTEYLAEQIVQDLPNDLREISVGDFSARSI